MFFDTDSLKMVRVTPYILGLGLTQDSSRVPITWDPRDTLITKIARVTPCISYYWFRQDSSRVPITWNPRETRIKNARVTPCI